MHNLRPDPADPSQLAPVLPPPVIDNRPWITMGGDLIHDIETLYYRCGNAFAASHRRWRSPEPHVPYVVADNLDGDVLAMCHSNGDLYIFTQYSCYRAVTDECGLWRVEAHATPLDYPPIRTEICTGGIVDGQVPGFALSGSYDPSSTSLNATDCARASRALADAYRDAACISASGRFIAPVFTRYRLLDDHNRVLFVSAPKLHVPPSRHPSWFRASLELDGPLGHVMSGSITAEWYGLRVVMPDEIPDDITLLASYRARRLEVQVSPQLHRLDEAIPLLQRLERSEVNTLALVATAPGLVDDEDADRRLQAMARRVIKASAADDGDDSDDSLFRTVLVMDNPYHGFDRTANIKCMHSTVDADLRAIARATQPVPRDWQWRCSLPHDVTADVVRRDGDVTLLANPSVRLFGGHPADYFVNSGLVPDSEVTAQVAVTFADGRRVVRRGTAPGLRNPVLSPLFLYPDADAVRADIRIRGSDGVVRGTSVTLSPCGRYACGLIGGSFSPAQLPVIEGADAFVSLEPLWDRVEYPGRLLAFTGDKPSVDVVGVEVCPGRITALHPVAVPSTSTWESSRSRYHIMSHDGIFSMGMSGSRPSAPVRIDSRPVRRHDAVVTATPADGQGAKVYVLAGRDLLSIEGNRVRTVRADVDADMLVWCGRTSELLLLYSSDQSSPSPPPALVMHCTGGGTLWSTRSMPPVIAAYSDASIAHITGTDALYDADSAVHPSPDTMIRCIHECDIPLKVTHPVHDVPRLSEITVPLTGTRIDGTVTILGHNGLAPAVELTRLTVSGTLARPLHCHLLLPPRLRLTRRLDALLTPDSRLPLN